MPYNDANLTELGTDPILSAAATLDIGPGVKAQDLHRDDFIWQQTHKAGDEKTYTLGQDVSMGLLVPGVKTTAANGATLVKPSLAKIPTGKRSLFWILIMLRSYQALTYGITQGFRSRMRLKLLR